MVITNEVTGAGYMRSNAFTLNNVFNGYTDKYSFIVRFRPDAGRPSHRDYAWILKIGYGGNSGMLMGLAGAGETRAVRLLTSQASWGLGSVTNTAWTEVGVAVDGTNFAWVVSSTTGNNETDANIKHLTTQYGEFVGNNKGVSTRPSGSLVVGTENPTADLIAATEALEEGSGEPGALKLGPNVIKDPESPTGYTVKFLYDNPTASAVTFNGDIMLRDDVNRQENDVTFVPSEYRPGLMRAGGWSAPMEKQTFKENALQIVLLDILIIMMMENMNV